MNKGKKKKRTAVVGIVLFSFGALICLALALFMVWADMEARLFDPSMSGESALGVRCPAIMGGDERVSVSAGFHNPLDRAARFVVRTNVSEGHVTVMRRLDAQIDLEPGERQRLEWEASAEDAVYGLFALVKVHLMGYYPLPGRQGSCGILLVNLPLPGSVIFAATLGLAVLGMGGGYALWVWASRPLTESMLDTSRAMIVLAALVLLGVFLGLVNIWMVGVVVVAITVLLFVVLIGYRLEKQRN